MNNARGTVKGIFMQTLAAWKRLVADLYKKLDLVTAGWLAVMRVITLTTLLVREKKIDGLTLAHKLTVPHSVENLLRGALKR